VRPTTAIIAVTIALLSSRARADDNVDVRVAGMWVEAESRHVNAIPLTMRTGFIPMPSLGAINTNIRRIAGPTAAEASGLLTSMAYGASVTAQLPGRFGDVAVAAGHPTAFVGDHGSALVAARMWLSPLGTVLRRDGSPLRLLAGAEESQRGTPMPARRYVVGAVYDHRLFTIGGDRVHARTDEQLARTVGAFVTLKPSSRLDGYFRYDVADRDAVDRARLITAGVTLHGLSMKRLLPAVDVHASVHRVQGTPVTPTPDVLTTQSIARVQFSVRF